MVILEFLTQHGIVKNNLQIIYKFKHLESNNRKATIFFGRNAKGFQGDDDEMGIKFINDKVFSMCPFWDIINISCMIKWQPFLFY
jgi:hypothetical protein